MKVKLISDVHFEFYYSFGTNPRPSIQHFVDKIKDPEIDVLVIAGDMAAGTDLMTHAFEILCRAFKEVVYIPGNHDHEGYSLDFMRGKRNREMEKHPNLHWLWNDVWEHHGKVFAGTTMWYTERPDNILVEHNFCDFRNIPNLRSWVYEENRLALEFLRDLPPVDVMITHHIPDEQGIPAQFKNTDNRFFLCQQPTEVLSKNRFWFFGHTHGKTSFTIGDCQFHCNPRGYPHEHNYPYDYGYVIEI